MTYITSRRRATTTLTDTQASKRTVTAPAAEGSPFDKFEALTRRLVNVPKDEIDREAEKDPRGKAKK